MPRPVYIKGVGMTPYGKKWEKEILPSPRFTGGSLGLMLLGAFFRAVSSFHKELADSLDRWTERQHMEVQETRMREDERRRREEERRREEKRVQPAAQS